MRVLDTVLVSRKFRVERCASRLPDGREHVFERVVHPGAAVILPFLDDDRLVMIQNFRHALGRELLELPAGTIDGDEPPIECARRELEEETGYRAAEMAPLMSFYSTPGFCTEMMHVFVARRLTAGAARPEAGEQLRTTALAADESLSAISEGRIIDAKSIVAILYHESFG